MTIPTFQEFSDANEEYAKLKIERKQAEEDVEKVKRVFRSKTYKLEEIGLINDILLEKLYSLQLIESDEASRIDGLIGTPGAIQGRYEMLESYIDKLDNQKIAVFADVPEHLAKLKDLETNLKTVQAQTSTKWKALFKEHDALQKTEQTEEESKKS